MASLLFVACMGYLINDSLSPATAARRLTYDRMLLLTGLSLTSQIQAHNVLSQQHL